MSGITGICDEHTGYDHYSTITEDSLNSGGNNNLCLDGIQVRTLAHFIGTLVDTRPAVPTGPLHYRGLQDFTINT